MAKLLLTKVAVKIFSVAANIIKFADEIFTDKAFWKILWLKVSKFINIEYSKHVTYSLTDFTLFSYVSEYYFLNIILQG